MTALTRNPQNTNPLQASKFQVVFPKITTVTYFCQSITVPGISTPPAVHPTPFSNFPVPGDKINFGTFNIDFIIDEEMWSWQIIHDWIRGYSFPCSFSEYRTLDRKNLTAQRIGKPQYSDGSLTIFSPLNNPGVKINFNNVFPVNLSPIRFSTQESAEDIITASAEFKYHLFNIDR